MISPCEYGVNAIEQRTNVAISGGSFPALPTWIWGYDSLGQVTGADSNINSSDRAYEYDTIGNRKKSANSLTLPLADNYTADALNQYSLIQPSEGGTGVSPVHDLDGNATAYPLPSSPPTASALVWDAENRLTEVKNSTGATIERNIFDGASRKIATTANGITTVYLYDDWNCIAEYQFDTQSFSLTLTKTRLWGTDLSGTHQGAGGVGGLLCESHVSKPQSPIYYPTYDGNGNVSEYLDSSGQVTAHFEYDPFGNTVVDTDTAGQFACRFSTKPLAFATGLYYYGYRYYDPQTGRWPSRDPIGERGGINLYGFVYNSTLNWIDKLGLKKPKCVSPDQQEDFDKRWDEAKKNGGDQTKKDIADIENSKHENTFNTSASTKSGVRPSIGAAPDDAHNGKGHSTHTNYNPNQGKAGGHSAQAIFEHELNHVADRNRGTLPKKESERERSAIDAENGGRKNRGEKERPYSDHERISPEEAEKWQKEKEQQASDDKEKCKCER